MSTYETKNLSKNTSHEKIFELFLFVNPLGTYCYRCENELLKFVRNSEFKVHYHFLTFHNLQTVNQYMKNQKLPVTDLDLRNDIYMKIYDASLSYKAALLQGKRLGHQFLIELQQQIHFKVKTNRKGCVCGIYFLQTKMVNIRRDKNEKVINNIYVINVTYSILYNSK